MKYRILSCLVVIPWFLFFNIHISTAESYYASLRTFEMCQFPCERYPEEGFGAGTLIRVPQGYIPIERLHVGDRVIDRTGFSKKVMNIAPRLVPRSVRLTVDVHTIIIGFENQLLLSHGEWIKAWDLKPHSYVRCADGHACHVQAEHVSAMTWLYMIAVEDQVLRIAPYDLIMQNST